MLTHERLEGLISAPDFPKELEWLNTDHPISLREFRGKLVLLDFWTYCCINCMHVIPDLKKLEKKYPEELVVLGVHSAKFLNEKGTDSIRQAILRYGIEHPVINDGDLEVWQQYAVHSWPTLVLINPNGRIIGVHSGEGAFDVFDEVIRQAADYFDKKGELKRSPLHLTLEKNKAPEGLLSFPGKISADAVSSKLFITDSNHNRILVAAPDGKVETVIGSGREGKTDGSFESAQFNHPQGTYLDGEKLYIADTENHLIRRADLKSRRVETLFGTGEQARGIGESGKGTSIALNSPWDLLVHAGKLYIAMAGSHQIYTADLSTNEIKPYAGSGSEARVDGPLSEAALAQPSGITTDGTRLYFADSEVSSVRSAGLDDAAQVETIIGKDLFEFGDIDGDADKARLQHALGVLFKDNQLYVADTYNSKIKIIDPVKKTSRSLAGTGVHGLKDGAFAEAEFFEPGGLAALGNILYVADTNNHAIRALDLAAGKVSTLHLSGLESAAASAPAKNPESNEKPFKGSKLALPLQSVKPGKSTITVAIKIPEGYKLTKNAPYYLDWKTDAPDIIRFSADPKKQDPNKIDFPFVIPFEGAEGKAVVTIEAVVYYCREVSGICLFDHMRATVPFEVSPQASSSAAQLDLAVKEGPKI